MIIGHIKSMSSLNQKKTDEEIHSSHGSNTSGIRNRSKTCLRLLKPIKPEQLQLQHQLTEQSRSSFSKCDANTKSEGKTRTSRKYKIVLMIFVVFVVWALLCAFTELKEVIFTIDATSFAMPSYIRKVQPFYRYETGSSYVVNKMSPGAYEEILSEKNGEKTGNTAHVLVLYYDEKRQYYMTANGGEREANYTKFEMLLHRRSNYVKGGNGKLSCPGGKVDIEETARMAARRETIEESMNHKTLKEEHFHLFYAYQDGRSLRTFWILFVNDRNLVTGPKEGYEQEMSELPELGITETSHLHRFFQVGIIDEWKPGQKKIVWDTAIDDFLWDKAENMLNIAADAIVFTE